MINFTETYFEGTDAQHVLFTVLPDHVELAAQYNQKVLRYFMNITS